MPYRQKKITEFFSKKEENAGLTGQQQEQPIQPSAHHQEQPFQPTKLLKILTTLSPIEDVRTPTPAIWHGYNNHTYPDGEDVSPYPKVQRYDGIYDDRGKFTFVMENQEQDPGPSGAMHGYNNHTYPDGEDVSPYPKVQRYDGVYDDRGKFTFVMENQEQDPGPSGAIMQTTWSVHKKE